MGHIESERCLFLKALGLKTLNKKATENSWSKSRQAVLCLTLAVFHYLRERVGETRDSERDTRADTHTHTQRERVFKKRVRERDGVLSCVL